MVRRLEKIRELSMIEDNQTKCCVFGLHITELPLIHWDSKLLNPSIQHVIEIFLAIVSYYMTVQYPKSEEFSATNKVDVHRRKFQTYVHFIKKHWKTGTNWVKEFLDKIELKMKTPDSELIECRAYLIQYLANRGISIDVMEKELDFLYYDIVFEEYFTERQTKNIVYKWGKRGNEDPANESKLITTHVNSQCTSCVGFVCFTESNRIPKMQGIISCPFYRATYSNEEHVLASANTILAYLQNRIMNDDRLQNKLLEVNPILQNVDWINRLSKIPFIVDVNGKPIQAEED